MFCKIHKGVIKSYCAYFCTRHSFKKKKLLHHIQLAEHTRAIQIIKKNHFWNKRGGQGLSAYGAVVCKLYLIRSHVFTHLNFSLSTKSVSLTLKPKKKNRGLIGLKLECRFDAKCLPTSRNLSISGRPWIWICYSGGANNMSKD